MTAAPTWAQPESEEPMPEPRPAPAGAESLLTLFIALAANVGVALAKLVAAIISQSSAMFAEAFHSLTDAGNEVLLLVAQRRSERPADEEHPLGYGREAYFWSLLASLAVFVSGALLSIRQGVAELIHSTEATSFGIAYAVLGVSLVVESLSLRRAYRQLRKEASELSREFIEYVDLSSDPLARAVFAEDAAAVIGNVVAATGLAIHQFTGSAIPDAIAAIVIGLVIGYVALQLARRNGDFLVGRRAPATIHKRVETIIAAQPGVRAVTELVITFLGPRRLWVIARIDVNDDLSGAAVKALVRKTQQTLTDESCFIARIDLAQAP
jgi:cation diffusion facilitator family transporter